MQITIPVSQLKPAIAGLSKVVDKAIRLPLLQHVRVHCTQEGAVTIQGVNHDSFASYRFTHEQKEAADLLVPFERLVATVKNCTTADSVIVSRKGDSMTLAYPLGGQLYHQSFTAPETSDWPALPSVEVEGEALDDDLKIAVSHAFACCTDDVSRPGLQGAWLDVTDAKSHYVMGTDGRHLYAANSFKFALQEPLLIPTSRFLGWSGFKDDGQWRLAALKEPSWFRLQSEHWTYLSKRPDYLIPNWRQILPDRGETRLTFNEQSSAFLIDLLPKLPGKDAKDHPIRFMVKDRKLSVMGREEKGEPTVIPVEEVEITGPDMAMTLNRDFALKALKWGLSVMEMTNSRLPVVFTGNGRRLVAMGVRAEEDEVQEAAAVESAPVDAQANSAAEADSVPQADARPEADSVAQATEIQPTTDAPAPAEEPRPTPQPKEQPMTETSEAAPTATPAGTTKGTTAAPTTPAPAESKSAVRVVLDQLDAVRESLRATLRQFGDIADSLRQLERERRAGEREIEAIREKLRAIQSVSI